MGVGGNGGSSSGEEAILRLFVQALMGLHLFPEGELTNRTDCDLGGFGPY